MNREDINLKRIGLDASRNLLIILISFVILFPVVYALSVSFRPLNEVFAEPHLIPNQFTISAYISFFNAAKITFLNSLLMATGTTILTLFVAIPGGYVFARKEFPARKILFYAVVLTVLVPPVMLVVPVTQIFARLGLRGTIFGAWLALMVGAVPIAIWILRDNFESLPPKIEEAAQVYGCSQFESFVRVVLPLAVPAVIAVAFLTFLFAWIEFLFTNLITGTDTEPVVVFLYQQFDPDRSIRYPFVLAGSFMIALPPVLFYAIAQRYLEQALNF